MVQLDQLTDYDKALHYFEWVIDNLNNPDFQEEMDRENRSIQDYLRDVKNYFASVNP